MVPFACVAVTALPLTPSGKVDRLTLAGRPLPQDLDAAYGAVLRERGPAAAPAPVLDTSAAPFAELLVELWADALARDTIGVHTDVFALGAESVTAMKVASQLTEVFRLTVPPSMLFDRPTAAGQAAWFTARDAANDGRLTGIARLLLAYEA